jgi:enediyne biosynthesis protein E4
MGFVVRKLWKYVRVGSLACLAITLAARVGSPSKEARSAYSSKAQKPWFTDIAKRSKFSYVSNNGLSDRKYFPQPMCGGIAAFDFDNDGKMDLFFTNGAHFPEMQKIDASYFNALLRNRGDGTFEDVTAKAGLTGEQLGFSFGVAAGDYDNDGYDDLFIANAGRNALYHNNGDGTFTDVTAGSGLDRKPQNLLSVGAAWIDYDNDGLLDLVVSNYTIWTPATDQRCYMSSKEEFYCSPTVYPGVATRLYHNLGHGKFEDVTERAGLAEAKGKGMGISIADYNNDGLMDIFVADDTERNFLFINQGNGKFKEEGIVYGVAYNDQGTSVSGMGSDAKDYDNDGRVDIVYNDLMNQIFGLFRNEGAKSFEYVSPASGIEKLSRSYSGWSIGFIDYDNDGWKDIYSANGDIDNFHENSRQHDTMFRNLNGTAFVDASQEMGPDFLPLGYHRGSAFVDLNNDGSMDLVVTALGEKPRILINNALSHNHWILLDLRGHKSNRDAIGARVALTTASGRHLYNHVTTSVGFMSSSDRRVHLGLDKENAIDSIEISWPSGIVQRLNHVSADQILKIDEPERSNVVNTSHAGAARR